MDGGSLSSGEGLRQPEGRMEWRREWVRWGLDWILYLACLEHYLLHQLWMKRLRQTTSTWTQALLLPSWTLPCRHLQALTPLHQVMVLQCFIPCPRLCPLLWRWDPRVQYITRPRIPSAWVPIRHTAHGKPNSRKSDVGLWLDSSRFLVSNLVGCVHVQGFCGPEDDFQKKRATQEPVISLLIQPTEQQMEPVPREVTVKVLHNDFGHVKKY